MAMTSTINYFQSYADYFWQWEDDMFVVAIPGGATIAYKDYLGTIIPKIAPQGLPPFGSLLLTLVATNPGGSVSIDTVYSIVSHTLGTTDDVILSKSISFLKLLSELPESYKSSDKRTLLLMSIFEGCHNVYSLKESRIIAEKFQHQSILPNFVEKAPFHRHLFETDFKTLSVLYNKFDSVQSIIERIASLPDHQQIEIEFENQPGTEPAADFVDELINNQNTYTVGSLIRWLWGGLNIPVHSVLPSQQPLGGISDLTNKGDFDKLLVSEFAHDDLTFLSRLANNEALYLHREVPPAHNDLKRIILIDASLKNWGTPKDLAFAVMLAIVKHPKTDIHCVAYVLGEKDFYPVSTENIHDIINALEITDGGLHAAKSLEAFLKEHSTDTNHEVFFITEQSTLKQSQLLKVMNDHHSDIHYLVHTDSDGNVDVFKKHQKSRRHVQHIKLPLKDLWQKRHIPIVHTKVSHKIGDAFPILFKDPGLSKKVFTAPDGAIFQINDERCVLRLSEKSEKMHTKGWDLIGENLPFRTSDCEIGISADGQYILLLFSQQTREIVLLNLASGDRKSVVFEHWKSTPGTSFVFDSGKFFHVNQRGTWSISTDGMILSGEYISQGKINDRNHELNQLEKKIPVSGGVFKNVHKLFINQLDELVFNTHGLSIKEYGQIKLVPTFDMTQKLAATPTEGHEFRFPDGSRVTINRSGMFILKSSDPGIDDIFIPTTLDRALGVATINEFAGNEYYLKEPWYQIILRDAGIQKLHTIKILRELLPYTLTDAKEMIDGAPIAFRGLFSKDRATHIKIVLETNGAKVEVVKAENRPLQQTIAPQHFYKKHVERYIKHILAYGA
jgi:ribosomal protein L7/L12